MLGGIDPIIIFHFYKLDTLSDALNDTTIPLVSKAKTFLTLPAIPIYLSEELTGLYIQAEDRDITVSTSTESLTVGEDNEVTQKAASSMINIEMIASKNSIGLTLLSALCDIVLPKVTSKEYAITYLHGSTTVFLGLFEGLTVTQNRNNDLVDIKLKLSRANAKSKPVKQVPNVQPSPEAVAINGTVSGTGGGVGPTGPTVPPLKGPPLGSQPPISMRPL